MNPLIQHLVDVEASPELCASVTWPELTSMYRKLDEGMIAGWSGVVHRLPFITPERCKEILAMAGEYTVNPDELAPYQIPECILPGFDGSFIDDWTILAYQAVFRGHWQLAKYTNSETDFHHDDDAELTIVINLTPAASGGTGIRTACHRVTEIGPLPVGHGLMFPGRMIHHRGLRTYGERNLLVGWLQRVYIDTEERIPFVELPEVKNEPSQ